MFRRTLAPLLALAVFAFMPAVAKADPLVGADQQYSVTLRANKEALVYFKTDVPTATGETVSEVTFKSVGVALKELVAYERISNSCQQGAPDCVNTYSTYGYSDRFLKAEVKQAGDDITVTLPEPAKDGGSYGIVMSYASSDYVRDRRGALAYEFKTLASDTRSGFVQVSLDVDPDLVLAGPSMPASPYPYMGASAPYSGADASAAMSSGVDEKLSSFVSQIGYTGRITKQANALAPGETLKVSGRYATSWLRLYGLTLLVVLLLAIAVLGGIFLGMRRALGVSRERREAALAHETKRPGGFGVNIVFGFWLSLLASILLIGGSYGMNYLMTSAFIYPTYGLGVPFGLFGVLSFALTLTVFAFPGLIIALLRKDLKAAFITYGMQIAWLVAFLVVVGILQHAGVIGGGSTY